MCFQRWQQIAVFNAENGEIGEQRLVNGDAFTSCFCGTLFCISLTGIGLVEAPQAHGFARFPVLRVSVEVLSAIH